MRRFFDFHPTLHNNVERRKMPLADRRKTIGKRWSSIPITLGSSLPDKTRLVLTWRK